MRKTLAVIVSILMIFTVLFSVLFIAAEADHECEGEHCHVCECIEICVTILQRFGFNTSSSSALEAAAFIAVLAVLIPAGAYTFTTPVSLKVRLNN